MRQDKQFVFELRKQGKSYREIQEKTSISRGTLCAWFKDIEWSKHIRYENNGKNITLSKERLKKLNNGRKIKLDSYYQKIEKEAEKEFRVFKDEALFMAGLMLYAGEGDKRSRNVSKISNSEFYIHKIFIIFSEKYLCIKRDNIKMSLIIYPDHNIQECIAIWGKEMNITKENFYKTQVIQGKETKNKLQYGVGMSIISSKVAVKKKILVWLELSKTVF
ncbi:hypothetical protein A3C57_03045 [Candidatus Nomurabacteria bacterium RIFCSPHIGHO2_02_FULL_33_12]|uniref:Uncharacterized protein n=1 Tax=Candidatus Nomurabacteria bacterium RIFCSPLOWO2_01_FULL_33_17 TaxID=1801764 RepID=A0A1F6WNB9_9BACT|nr:MAG: hypothetical protein A3C57_03045 [Candidatus Nomurabacteria bacterium RIFCSPHIGHO2_02_FULL_33_12]OGI83363.1 MAG: hypothetical protein A2903_01205 [Candidatus Nomurabacteria bacterium RIFCSPLOWO2_01_FULL_33_17]